MNKYAKVILGVLGTILLGAIGSGVWEWVLSDLFSWFGNSFVTLVGTLSESYVNSLYKDIWKGENYPFLKDIYAYTFTIYLTFPMIIILIRRLPKRRKSEDNNDKNVRYVYTLVILLFAMFVGITIKVWETAYTANVAQKLTANIRILAPYIDNEKLLVLNSKFSQVEDQKSVNDLRKTIESFSKEHGVKLHEMDFL